MKNNTWFTRYSATPAESPLRLFAFPFSGGGPTAFKNWEAALPGVDVFCAVLPARDKRLNEPPVGEMQKMVTGMMNDFLALADRPFVLFGHSLGALIAYEMACHAAGNGIQPQQLIVSAFRAPGQPRRNKLMHTLSDDDFLKSLVQYGGTPPAVLQNRDIMRFALPALRADFQLHETYQPSTYPLLECPIAALCGTHDQHVSEEEMHGWSNKTAADFSLHRINGDHFFVLKQQEKLLAQLRTILTKSPSDASFV
jgi:surfactin synthase thioesterase subunit